MVAHAGFRRRLSCGVAMAWLMAAAGVAGTVLSSGCGEITTTPLESGMTGQGEVALKIEPAALSVTPGKSIEIAFTATNKNGSLVKDGTIISLESDGLGTIAPTSASTTNGTAHATFHAGTATGSSTIKASTGGATYTVSVKIDSNAGTTPPTAKANDAIDPASITWLHVSPAAYRVTATLSNVQVYLPQTISWQWTHPYWPGTNTTPSVLGTMWVIGKVDGRWYGAGWEWLTTDLSQATTEAYPGQPPFIQTKASPLNGWYPQPGEEVGFLVSTITPSWDGVANSPNERSPIVVVRWP